MIKTVEWTKDGVRMLDQRLLPSEETYLMLRSYDEVAEAIRKMVIRGAPAIGVAAAMGIALGASQSVGTSVADWKTILFISATSWARRVQRPSIFSGPSNGCAARFKEIKQLGDVEAVKKKLVDEALAIFEEDIAANRAIGKHGEPLIPDGATVLTHCNAGALATAGDYGTALGVVRGARTREESCSHRRRDTTVSPGTPVNRVGAG
jgi:methylthioribose-1-phosphate isomerase